MTAITRRRWRLPAHARGSRRLGPLFALGAAGTALAVAGCGGSGGGSGGGSTGSASAAAGAGAYGAAPTSGAKAAAPTTGSGSTAVKVNLASSKLGRILVDGNGRTLYLFQADKSSASTCNGACASAWPPLTTSSAPLAGSGIAAAKLGTTKRADGTNEVTFNGHPLYYYVGDNAPGQTTGQALVAFGAEWDVLSGAGNKIG